jgi:MFS family permease
MYSAENDNVNNRSAAALELGALFGALASGILADKYSRRHSIFLACSEPEFSHGL